MNFIVFPGQGSQKIGMGKELSENAPEAKEVFEEVNEAIGFNLSKLMWEGSDTDIALTSNAQPALMACGAAIKALESEGIEFGQASYIAGHSLGEYSALCAAGSLSLMDTAKLLRTRGKAMQDAVPFNKGAMAAFIGVDITTSLKILEQVSSIGVCNIGNDNADGQVVISGDIRAI